MLEEIKCEENMVYLLSLGPAKTTQGNHFSKPKQRDEKCRRKLGNTGSQGACNIFDLALALGHLELLCLVCRVHVLFSGLKS